MRTFVVPFGALLFFGIAACSSDAANGRAGVDTCSAVDICSEVTFQHLNTLCGTTITGASPTSLKSTHPSEPDVNGCLYSAPGPLIVGVNRDCFTSGGSASVYFDNVSSPVGWTNTDVPGVGDQASMADGQGESTFYVLSRNLVLRVNAFHLSGGLAATHQCVQTVAGEVLAL